MLSELCHYLNNYFNKLPNGKTRPIHEGKFTISGGNIDLTLVNGQYFRIEGSILNDGVYQYPATDLKDETFEGAVWEMAVPPDVIRLADDIKAWRDKYDTADSPANSPYQSESFGGYSYTKGFRNASQNQSEGTWQGVFAARLAQYVRIRSVK